MLKDRSQHSEDQVSLDDRVSLSYCIDTERCNENPSIFDFNWIETSLRFLLVLLLMLLLFRHVVRVFASLDVSLVKD